MKIGINVSFLRKPNIGIGQYTLNIVKEILNLPESASHNFILYFEDKTNFDIIVERSNVAKKIIKTPFYKRDDLIRKTAWERILLPKTARADQINIFFSPYNGVSCFPLTRHIVTLHDVVWKKYEKLYLNNFRKVIYAKQTYEALKKCNHLITVSEYSKKEIVKYLEINPQHITVIKNGIGEEFRYLNDRKPITGVLDKFKIDTPYLLYLGGFEKRKNVDVLLSAFKKICDHYPNILGDRKLVIVGEIWKQENPLITDVPRHINELAIEEKIILTGEVSEEEKICLFNGADLFVFPSLYEGFGMPVLEAMASGCPVLAGNKSSVPEIGSDSIEYFNPEREDELIQQLTRLLADPSARAELSKKGIDRARAFSWKKAAASTLEILTNSQC